MSERSLLDAWIARLDAAWDELAAPFAGADPERIAAAPDGGWSARDHLAHVVAWDRHRLALLEGRPPVEAVGVDTATWATDDEDAINAALAAGFAGRPFAETWEEFQRLRAAIPAALRATPWERLRARYRQLHPEDETRGDGPFGWWVVVITEGHAADHVAAIRRLLGLPPVEQDRAALLTRMDRAWEFLQAALKGVPEERLAWRRGDDWSVVDHLTHLIGGETYIAATLDGSPPLAALGVDPAVAAEGVDAVNAAIRERARDTSAPEALAALAGLHAANRARVETLPEERLAVPYARLHPGDPLDDDDSLGSWIDGNVGDHLAEHVHSVVELLLEPN